MTQQEIVDAINRIGVVLELFERKLLKMEIRYKALKLYLPMKHRQGEYMEVDDGGDEEHEGEEEEGERLAEAEERADRAEARAEQAEEATRKIRATVNRLRETNSDTSSVAPSEAEFRNIKPS